MRLIDTHVHFWDLRRDELRYPWLQPGVLHPILGDIDAIKSPLFDAAAFAAETRFAGVAKVVHVEADARAANLTSEPDWVASVAAQAGLQTAIVAHTDLGAAPGAQDVRSLSERAGIRGIRDFGIAAPNMACKLSGLAMTDWGWSVESLRRWVVTSLESFGPSRCMFGSNWPLDRMASSYDALVTAFRELIGSCSAAEQEAICSANAENLYFSA
jgi:predicted TIM-barrel fold metal-dependent hydrolase